MNWNSLVKISFNRKAILITYDCFAITEPFCTVTVNGYMPPAVGVPIILTMLTFELVSIVNPDGKAPEILHEKDPVALEDAISVALYAVPILPTGSMLGVIFIDIGAGT